MGKENHRQRGRNIMATYILSPSTRQGQGKVKVARTLPPLCDILATTAGATKTEKQTTK